MPLDVAGSTYIPLLERLSVLFLAAALVLSYGVVFRLDNYDTPFATLRRRFVLGIPWGTLVIAATLYLIYHGVQGAGEPGGPNVVAFRSWSLWYPQSVLFSWLSHASESHLTGNMLGTVVYGSIVEYAWSHYPTATGRQTFSSWRTNPFVRIGVFVLGTSVVGIVGSVTVPGAIIGFSGVIFAYAGFAIVARPILAAGGILGIEVLDLVYSGLRNPVGFTEADTRFITPWWADTALQGHLFGLVVGVLLAVVLFRYREQSLKLAYIWFVALVFAVSRSMWTIFWFLSETEFILFRGLGAAAVLVLASLVAMATISSDRSLWPGRLNIPIKTIGTGVLVLAVILVAVAGVPYNLVDVSPGEETDSGIEIDDYTVTYAENVEDQYTSLDLPIVGDLLAVNTSGVIVTSDRRNVWSLQTSAEELAFEGFSVVVVGDATWREVVIMNHTQWEVAGGNTTYKVYGQHWQVMDEQRLLFESQPALGEPIINGSRFSIAPSEEFYDIALVRDNETVGRKPIPSQNETVELRGVMFERDENELVAIHEETELSFATFRTEREE